MEYKDNTFNRTVEGIGSVLKWLGLTLAFIGLFLVGLDDIAEVYGEFNRKRSRQALTDELNMDRYRN
tara:strand:+ start:234 stop:434 length:201 start_codon:yes stop_codon:yes gene_type:complete